MPALDRAAVGVQRRPQPARARWTGPRSSPTPAARATRRSSPTRPGSRTSLFGIGEPPGEPVGLGEVVAGHRPQEGVGLTEGQRSASLLRLAHSVAGALAKSARHSASGAKMGQDAGAAADRGPVGRTAAWGPVPRRPARLDLVQPPRGTPTIAWRSTSRAGRRSTRGQGGEPAVRVAPSVRRGSCSSSWVSTIAAAESGSPAASACRIASSGRPCRS